MKSRKYFLTAIIMPLLFGLFPLLFLYAQNTGEMMIRDILVPLIQVVGFSLVVTTLLGLILKNFLKSALITALLLLSYFSSGHIIRILPRISVTIGAIHLQTVHLFSVILAGVLITAIVFIIRTKKNLLSFIQICMTIGGFLVLIQVVQAGFTLVSRPPVITAGEIPEPKRVVKRNRPDVYFIVLDGYADREILKEMYNIDNSNFISFLKEKGFYVPEKTYTHYCQTVFSLGSTLNMNYIDSLGDFDREMTDRIPLARKLQSNQVVKNFKGAGYSIAAFSTGYGFTELADTDLFLKPSGTMSEFENVLLSTTMFPLAQDSDSSPFARHRKRVLYTLDKFPKITEIPSPRFVFAHIVSPHPPFIFDREGNHIEPQSSFHFADASHLIAGSPARKAYYIKGYGGQLTYITELVKIMINKLFERYGENKPIIIILSDHGPGSELSWSSLKNSNIRERFSILNAYYFPGHEGNPAYGSITPVNMFRVIFNTYLGTAYPLLPRKNYYSSWPRPYDFQDVTDQLPLPQNRVFAENNSSPGVPVEKSSFSDHILADE